MLSLVEECAGVRLCPPAARQGPRRRPGGGGDRVRSRKTR
jgi:hypothetical protein